MISDPVLASVNDYFASGRYIQHCRHNTSELTDIALRLVLPRWTYIIDGSSTDLVTRYSLRHPVDKTHHTNSSQILDRC